MIVIPVPFDLRLWTGVDDGERLSSEVYSRFAVRRDLARGLNELLSQAAIPDCRLRVPLTQRLFEQLSNTPPWSEVQRGSFRHRLKTSVLALLRNKRGAAGLTLYLSVGDVTHLYFWEEPEGFFVPTLAPMKDDWVEMVGMCVFENAVVARGFDEPLPVLGSWIVTPFSEASYARIARRPVVSEQSGEDEERSVPLLFQTDLWAWRRVLREWLWQDERLPLGRVGFCPQEHWQPGDRPRRYQQAYRDDLGGLWEWEAGRASDERNPFGGHWNVQLPDASVKSQWVRWIETCSGWQITSPPGLITHVNVEPDGWIADPTFDRRE